MFIIDCHTHTSVSPDGNGTAEELYKKAEEIGLKALAVTEHCEVNRFFSYDYYGETPRNEFEVYFDGNIFENAMKTLSELKKNQRDVILSTGIELGQINSNYQLTDIILKDKRLDFVIASLHELLGREDFAFIDYTKEDYRPLLDDYFSQLLEIAESGKYDVLGHITYPIRYISGEYGIKVDMEKYYPVIEKILEAVIKNGKGIEVNTSGLRQKYGKTFPDYDIIEKYRKLGGKIITIGSDAHCSDDLAKGTDKGIELVKKAGFKKVCCFIKHKPVYFDI